jgi:hypothetical protein
LFVLSGVALWAAVAFDVAISRANVAGRAVAAVTTAVQVMALEARVAGCTAGGGEISCRAVCAAGTGHFTCVFVCSTESAVTVPGAGELSGDALTAVLIPAN